MLPSSVPSLSPTRVAVITPGVGNYPVVAKLCAKFKPNKGSGNFPLSPALKQGALEGSLDGGQVCRWEIPRAEPKKKKTSLIRAVFPNDFPVLLERPFQHPRVRRRHPKGAGASGKPLLAPAGATPSQSAAGRHLQKRKQVATCKA